MSKKLVKVYKVFIVRPSDDGFELAVVSAMAHETPHNYTFSHAEAEKSRCHRVGKHGEWAPSAEEAMTRFHKAHAKQADLHQRLLAFNLRAIEAVQIMALPAGVELLSIEDLWGGKAVAPDLGPAVLAAVELARSGMPVDLVTMVGLLHEKGQLDQVGGALNLAHLLSKGAS